MEPLLILSVGSVCIQTLLYCSGSALLSATAFGRGFRQGGGEPSENRVETECFLNSSCILQAAFGRSLVVYIAFAFNRRGKVGWGLSRPPTLRDAWPTGGTFSNTPASWERFLPCSALHSGGGTYGDVTVKKRWRIGRASEQQ